MAAWNARAHSGSVAKARKAAFEKAFPYMATAGQV